LKIKKLNNKIEDNYTSRLRHSLFGFVLGDCLGVPYEFKLSGTFKFEPFVGNGTHKQQPGTWSDDTALTLAFLDAIVDGEYNETIHKNNLHRFMEGEYFPDGRCFDVGIATSNAIDFNFSISMDNSFGNGGLLRIWTLASLSFLNEWTTEKEREIMRQANSLTHSTQELYMTCCELFISLLKSIYNGENNFEPYRLWYDEISQKPDFKQYETRQGHICNAIFNVMDTFFKFPEYDDIMEPMRHIIEKGGDTDSNAAFLGALLGAKQNIPIKYLKKIRKIERIDKYYLTAEQQQALNKAKRYAAEDGYFGEVEEIKLYPTNWKGIRQLAKVLKKGVELSKKSKISL